MTMQHDCDRSTLAESSLCRVELCDCGSIHLTVGPVTMRLQPKAYHMVTNAMIDGSFQLDLRAITQRPPYLSPVGDH